MLQVETCVSNCLPQNQKLEKKYIQNLNLITTINLTQEHKLGYHFTSKECFKKKVEKRLCH